MAKRQAYYAEPPPQVADPKLVEYIYRQFRMIQDHLRVSDPFVAEPWDDLRFPAQGIDTAGPTSPPGIGDDGSLLFDNVVDQQVVVIAQMPHTWMEGSEIRPHIHWSRSVSGTGEVAWLCEYSMADVGETFGSFATLTLTTAVETSHNYSADVHLITEFGALDMTGKEISCIVKFRITRDTSEDTYGADAKLIEFDIHYQKDASGSNEEYRKRL